MKLGFVSAILPDLDLAGVLGVAAELGYAAVEVMCWPPGRADRRYAGICHIDVTTLDDASADAVRRLQADTGVTISGLGYYPNPLSPNGDESQLAIEHLRRVMHAARRLGVGNVNTFVGRDPAKSVDENWPRFLEVFRPLVALAEELDLRLGIENCPMLFSRDEWPGGKNLACSPAIWRRMFTDIPSPRFGLNYDPSHLVWLFIDPASPIREFAHRIFHVHAKDARVDRHKLQEVGTLGLDWHTPKLPGMGDVDWGMFFGALSDARFDGAVCVEVEDRAYEGSLMDRRRALMQSERFLRQYVV